MPTLPELQADLAKYQAAIDHRKANPVNEDEESRKRWFDRMQVKIDETKEEIGKVAQPAPAPTPPIPKPIPQPDPHINCPHCGKAIYFISKNAVRAGKQDLYAFGWPSHFGGADTKFVNTIKLWSEMMNVTAVANFPNQVKEAEWTNYLDRLGVKYMAFDEFAQLGKLSGIGISLCNKEFITKEIKIAKSKGLRIIWSSEMMWHFGGELDLVRDGTIDVVLYTSQFNKDALAVEYNKARPDIESHIVGNYIDPINYPFKQRMKQDTFTIGRLSRHDPDKYPPDFPLFYESLKLKNPRYSVMGWSDDLAKIYKWYTFGPEWQLIHSKGIPTIDFLHGLDLFVYSLGPKFRESWGRVVVEAMLTGCVPVVPTGHNFPELIVDGHTGFMCRTMEEYRNRCQILQDDDTLRNTMARQAHEHAKNELCNAGKHKKVWAEVFGV